MQVDPIKPKLKPPGTKRLKLIYDGPVSKFAFKINFRRHTKEKELNKIRDEHSAMSSALSKYSQQASATRGGAAAGAAAHPIPAQSGPGRSGLGKAAAAPPHKAAAARVIAGDGGGGVRSPVPANDAAGTGKTMAPGRAMSVGTDAHCSPRHNMHFEPSFLHVIDILCDVASNIRQSLDVGGQRR